MKFELEHALKGLDDRTPTFFKFEALADIEVDPANEDAEPARETAARVLSTKGDPNAVRLLKEILRLV